MYQPLQQNTSRDLTYSNFANLRTDPLKDHRTREFSRTIWRLSTTLVAVSAAIRALPLTLRLLRMNVIVGSALIIGEIMIIIAGVTKLAVELAALLNSFDGTDLSDQKSIDEARELLDKLEDPLNTITSAAYEMIVTGGGDVSDLAIAQKDMLKAYQDYRKARTPFDSINAMRKVVEAIIKLIEALTKISEKFKPPPPPPPPSQPKLSPEDSLGNGIFEYKPDTDPRIDYPPEKPGGTKYA